MDAKANEDKCRTAAYANQHHNQSSRIAKDIPGGDLIQKAQMIPDEWYALKQDAPARLWRFRTDEISRHFSEFLLAYGKCRACGANERNNK